MWVNTVDSSYLQDCVDELSYITNQPELIDNDRTVLQQQQNTIEKQKQKVNKDKSQFFEKGNKIDRLVAKLIKKNERHKLLLLRVKQEISLLTV